MHDWSAIMHCKPFFDVLIIVLVKFINLIRFMFT